MPYCSDHCLISKKEGSTEDSIRQPNQHGCLGLSATPLPKWRGVQRHSRLRSTECSRLMPNEGAQERLAPTKSRQVSQGECGGDNHRQKQSIALSRRRSTLAVQGQMWPATAPLPSSRPIASNPDARRLSKPPPTCPSTPI